MQHFGEGTDPVVGVDLRRPPGRRRLLPPAVEAPPHLAAIARDVGAGAQRRRRRRGQPLVGEARAGGGIEKRLDDPEGVVREHAIAARAVRHQLVEGLVRELAHAAGGGGEDGVDARGQLVVAGPLPGLLDAEERGDVVDRLGEDEGAAAGHDRHALRAQGAHLLGRARLGQHVDRPVGDAAAAQILLHVGAARAVRLPVDADLRCRWRHRDPSPQLTRTIFPGFMMLSGSIARFTAPITASASPCSAARKSILP